MKQIILIATVFALSLLQAFAEDNTSIPLHAPDQPQTGLQLRAVKIVKVRDPLLNNILVTELEQPTGWQYITGTDWRRARPCVTIKGVHDDWNAFLLIDGYKGYSSQPEKPAKNAAASRYQLEPMRAEAYLDFVFSKQFPGLKGAVKIDYLPLESENMTERAKAVYRFVTEGDTILHVMEVKLQYTTISEQLDVPAEWNQTSLVTYTAPQINMWEVERDVRNIVPSVNIEVPYERAMLSDQQQSLARKEDRKSRGSASKKKSDERLSSQVKEEYIVQAGWTKVLEGTEKYQHSRKSIVETTAGIARFLWDNNEKGYIYTADTYIFNPIDPIVDKKGRVIRDFSLFKLVK